MSEEIDKTVKMIEDQKEKEELSAPTIDMKLLVEEMNKTMQKALVEVLTPGGARNESKFFSTPEPVKTPQKEEDRDCLNSLMQYLCKTVLQLPEDCIIFEQEEVESLLDLASLSKEDIFEIENESGRRIKKVHARKLQQLAWWYVDEASKYPGNQIKDDF